MKNEIGIYIPTRGRWDKQTTLKCIPESLLPRTFLVIHDSEKKQYAKYNNVLLFKYQGLSDVKQMIMEIGEYRYVIIIDDDLVFNARRDGHLVVANEYEVIHMFEVLEEWLKSGFAHVGVSARGGNNRVEEDFIENSRICLLCGLDSKVFHDTGCRFDRVVTMQDFDCTLYLLGKGYPNRISYQYACGHTSGSKGGCSLYRNSVTQEQSAFFLKKQYPYCVTVAKKVSKDAWGGIGDNVRYDVNVQWKKAYCPKIKNDKGLGKFF